MSKRSPAAIARAMGAAAGLVGTALLVVVALFVAVVTGNADADPFDEAEEASIVAGIESWTPSVPSPTGWEPPRHERSDQVLEGCDSPHAWTWTAAPGQSVRLVRAACRTPLAAFDVVDNYAGEFTDIGLPASPGNLARVHQGDGSAQVVWRERASVLALHVRCDRPDAACARSASEAARELNALAPDVPRADPAPDDPLATLATPVTAWIVLVAPVRLVQVLRRPRWGSSSADPRYHDMSAVLRSERRRRGMLRTARGLLLASAVVAVLNALGMVFDPALGAAVVLVVSAGLALVAFRSARRLRTRWPSTRPDLPRGTGARALAGLGLGTWATTLTVGVLAVYGATAVFTVMAGTVGLDPLLLTAVTAQDSGSEADALRWVGMQLALGYRNDLSFLLVFVVLPTVALAFLLRSLGKRLRAADGRAVLLADARPPVLYLRSFDEDALRIPAPSLRRGLLERLAPLRRRSFEQVLEDSLRRYGPLVAVSDPRTRLPQLGAARVALPHDVWQREVAQMTRAALVVVMAATPTEVRPGLQVELSMLGHDPEARVVVILAPYSKGDLWRRWSGFLRSADPFPLFSPLAGGWLPEGTHVVAHTPTEGWRAWGCDRRTDRSYALTVDAAFQACSAEWSRAQMQQAATRTGRPEV